jgi:hypothetical protein
LEDSTSNAGVRRTGYRGEAGVTEVLEDSPKNLAVLASGSPLEGVKILETE